MPIAADLSFIGIAKEATPGTPAAATSYIAVSEMKPKINVDYLDDQGMRGSNAKVYDMRPGVAFAEYELGGSVYPDTLGFLLTGILGDVTTTGASAPFSHAISLGNAAQPPSYTISDFNGFNTRQFAGCKFSEVQLKFAGNGMLEYTAKAIASAYGTTTKPTSSFTGVTAVPSWLGVATIGGSASTLITQGDLTLKRSVEPIHNVDGTQTPYAVFAGGDLDVSGSLTAVYEDDATLYAGYLAGTQTSLDFNWQAGAGASLTQVKAHMTTVQVTSAEINRGSGKYVELAVKFDALANITDKGASGGYAPIAVTLQNALAAATYK